MDHEETERADSLQLGQHKSNPYALRNEAATGRCGVVANTIWLSSRRNF